LYDFDRYAATIRALRSIGIRYLVVHMDDYSQAQREADEPGKTLAAIRSSGQIVSEGVLITARGFELQPWPKSDRNEAADVRIDATAFSVSASQNSDRVPNLTDGDVDTRWFADQDGSHFIELTFRGTVDVARVEIVGAERSLDEYPRQLEITSTDSNGGNTIVYRDSPYPEILGGFLKDHRYPAATIALPPNSSVRLRLRETATVPGRWWSVHELRVWRRSGNRP
jgi:hypothetical protein